LLLLFTGCADQTTAPELELTTSYAKGGEPGKPGGGGGGGDPANPVITYAAGTPGKRTLWVMDADGSNKAKIYDGTLDMSSSWSDQGDGTIADPFVILVSRRTAEQPLDKLELVLEEGVPKVQRITTLSDEGRRYLHAAVRPGGEDFVAVDLDYEAQTYSLVLGDMSPNPNTTLSPELIYQPEGGEWLSQPAWNRDGTKVAFLETSWDDVYTDVRILDLNTSPAGLATALSVDWVDGPPSNVSWTRTSNSNGLLLDLHGVIYRVDLSAPALDNPVCEGRDAEWSPDDTQIIYWNGGLWVKTFGERRDQRLKGGTMPDWRRNPLQ
jgi:hypothetical protein